MKNPYYLIQKNDEKAKCWGRAAQEINVDLVPMSTSPIFFVFVCLRLVLSRGRPSGVILRYLNDYRSFSKTLVRCISEISLIMFIKLFGIKLFWICHNVDKETVTFYPNISRFRRFITSKYSSRVFVTDQLLIKHFNKHFNLVDKKCYSVGFGLPIEKKKVDHYAIEKAKEFIKRHQIACKTNQTQKLMVTFCAGSIENDKYLHFDYLPWLIETVKESGYKLIAIVAGDFTNSKRCKGILKSLSENPNILLFEEYTQFSDVFIEQSIDFYWRAYSDISVPYTVYEAAKFGKPIMCLKLGFLQELVSVYNLGPIINLSDNKEDISEALASIELQRFNKSIYNFRTHASWNRLIELLENSQQGSLEPH